MNYLSPEKSSDELYLTYGWRLAARKENVDNQKPIADRSSTASKKDNQDLSAHFRENPGLTGKTPQGKWKKKKKKTVRVSNGGDL